MNILRKVLHTPFIIKTLWRAENAIKGKNWEELAELTTNLHNSGFSMNKTRFWLGCALINLNQNEEALKEFERIDGKLNTLEEEAARHWNHTLALYRTNRAEECYELLMQKIDPYWPTETYTKARNFLTEHGFDAFEIKV
jgi:tetratricopeptide (TPR) repeat protein